eukprot:TRINITY_DN12984_c0_g1_i2.p1 TRINITY_DN12984_c0_g1~~TRINITY_DN12984_c0_g1_i2.p1  ORF type:complete len:152 (+),score=34.94 TRINITY_DN12984_c0_g1_i2:507-962(+)
MAQPQDIAEEEAMLETEIELGGEEEEEGEVAGYFEAEPTWYEKPLQYEAVAKVWRLVYPVLYQLYSTADYLGEKVADALGITQSRFQYAIDEHNRQLAKKRKKEAYIRKKLLEEREKERKRLGLPDPNARATSMPEGPMVKVQPDAVEESV